MSQMGFTKARSFAKAFIWECGMFILQTLVLWWYLHNFYQSLLLNMAITLAKVLILFGYERLWKKIIWGKL